MKHARKGEARFLLRPRSQTEGGDNALVSNQVVSDPCKDARKEALAKRIDALMEIRCRIMNTLNK